MPPILPFWFKQRQCKAEPVGEDNLLRLTGPNLREAFVRIHKDDKGLWGGSLRFEAEGEDVASTPHELDNPQEAWKAAFELYRNHVIV